MQIRMWLKRMLQSRQDRFFESRGYMVIQEQGVVRKGVLLKNYRMEKQPLQKEK